MIYIITFLIPLFALMDRLLMAALQRRSGPYNIGWFGLLQPIVDGIKLIKKELIIVQKYNGIMFISGPILLFFLSLLLWSIIIYNYKIKLVDFMFSILFQLILNTVNIFIQLICGWAGNSKYSFIGSLRSGAQVLS